MRKYRYPDTKSGESAKVYKTVVSGGNNKLALLVAVFSPKPEETLKAYLDHACVKVIEEPAEVQGIEPDSQKLDFRLAHRPDPPHYAVLNDLELRKFDRALK